MDRGEAAQRYLADRGLTEETIRAARIGYWPEDEWFEGVFPNDRICVPTGIIIPWFDGAGVTLLNVRRDSGKPKYQAVRGSLRGGRYAGRGGIAPGKPLVIVEGELDALLLGQQLLGMAAVVTPGSAGTRPSARALNAMLGASTWIAAGDADAAGNESADAWLARSDRCIRVAPPEGKDWTEARERGIDLRFWWQSTLDRVARRPSRPDVLPPDAASTTDDGQRAIPEGYILVDGFLFAEPPPCPWRDAVVHWPDEWRRRWGYVANRYCHEGRNWRDAEIQAAKKVTAEREAVDGGAPPVMEPDPDTALWRDFLDDMIANGKAARFLSSRGLR